MFRGSFTALITPFKNDAVDWAAFERVIEHQIEQGTHGLVPSGTTGENPTLTAEERRDVIKRTVEIAGGRVPVIAGTGTNATASTIEWQAFAKEVGADAGLVVSPYYNKPSQDGLKAHFQAVADAVALPVIVYNIPGRSIVDILPETMAEMTQHPNIVGVKDATGDVVRVTQHRKLIGPDFVQLSGEDASALGYNAHGGHGVISVSSNVAPGKCAEFQNLCANGNYAAAREIGEALQDLHEVLFSYPSPAPAKYALSRIGLCEPDVRLPLVECPDGVKARIDTVLEGLELI